MPKNKNSRRRRNTKQELVDHLPQFKKDRAVSRLLDCSLRRILDEVAKCQVVCSNCHRLRTHNRRKAKAG